MEEDVCLLVTDKINDAVRVYKDMNKNCSQENIEKQILHCENKKIIKYKNLLEVFRALQKADKGKYRYLHELVEGSCIYVQPLKDTEKSPELVKRLNKLKAEQEQKQYDLMVKSVNFKNKANFRTDLGTEVRSTAKQIMTIVNFLLSILGCAVFAFVSSQYAWDSLAWRVIFSVIVGSVVGLAELYFLARSEL